MKSRKLLLNVLMVAVFATCFSLGTVHAEPGVFPDLSDWVDTWFKVTITRSVFHYSDVGVKPTPSYKLEESMGKAFINITNWDPDNHSLTADIYVKDHDTGEWLTTPFATIDIQYFAGNRMNFIGSAQLVTPDDVTMNLIFGFTGTQNSAGNFKLDGKTTLSTIASNMLEIDDVVGSTERWVGSVKISGPMVPVSKVPFTPGP